MKLISKNKKADFEYFFSDSVEAGVVLTGAEVKSVKLGHANINDAFCLIRGGECWLKNAFVASYEKGSAFNPEERRDRKLLLHRDEIDRLEGKKLHDKRQTIKDRDIKRDAEREIKNYK